MYCLLIARNGLVFFLGPCQVLVVQSLPHMTLTASTSSLTHFIHLSYLSVGVSFTNKPYDSRLIYTLRCSTAEWRINTNPISYRLWAQVGWVQRHRDRSDRTWRPRARRIEFGRNLGTDPYQIQERCVKNSLTEGTDEFGKVGAETSYLQSQMHSDYDSAESIADSDLEDGELRKMLASPLYMQSAMVKTVQLLSNDPVSTGDTCCGL